MPQTWDWKMLRMQSAQAWIFGLYCCWLSGKHQFVHKEKQAPYALPVSHHDGEDTLRYRPTQGWTVDEAGLLCKVIYLLRPSSLGLDGGGILHTHPWRLNEACTWVICYPLANIVGLAKSVFLIPAPTLSTNAENDDVMPSSRILFRGSSMLRHSQFSQEPFSPSKQNH